MSELVIETVANEPMNDSQESKALSLSKDGKYWANVRESSESPWRRARALILKKPELIQHNQTWSPNGMVIKGQVQG